MLTLGAAGKIHFSDTLALFFDPQFGFGLTQRDAGNPNWFFLPLELQFQLSDTSVFKILSGMTGPVSNFGDAYQAPFGLGVVFNINEAVDLGAPLQLRQPAGQSAGRGDAHRLPLAQLPAALPHLTMSGRGWCPPPRAR